MSLENRREFLFIYDVSNANPNGDPLDENKPRIDAETGKNLVTDVRLKRTVRDYLLEYKGKEIFVKEKKDEKGNVSDAKTRAKKDFGENAKNILDECIDIRLFGATIPIEKGSITYTGPVQAKFGTSLHRVKMELMKGTAVFSSGDNKGQGTFRTEYILPYSLIAFYIIVNENNAKHTNLSDEDIELFKEALWFGTKNLITRSKIEHNPRFLLELKYKKDQFSHIGNLDNFLKLETNKDELEIRNTDDYTLNIEKLIEKIEANSNKIEERNYYINDIKLNTIPNNWKEIVWKV